MSEKMELSGIVIILTIIGSCVANDAVPVLIWGNKDVPDLMTPAAGHSVSSSDFVDTVLNHLNNDGVRDVIVFIQDQLSLDDISHSADAYNQNSDGGDFHNIKTLMSSHPSTHLPRVTSPVDAIKSWKKKFDGSIHELKSPYNINSLPLDSKSSNLILVHLPNAKSLKEADMVIGSISSEMDLLGRPYNALYTAVSSSKIPREKLYMGRHLLAEEDMPTHFYNISSCIFFYADNITFRVKEGKESFNWTFDAKADTTGSTCSPIPKLVLNFKVDGSSLKNLTLVVSFKNTTTGYWEAKQWLITYTKGTETKKDVSLAVGSIYAPYGHSYHCTTPKIQQIKNTTNTADESVAMFDMKNLQLQGYKIKNDQFGRASDCIGFFTIPIWMGLISMLVLIAILVFGVMMLSSIRTMDRFDDPKGKTITVNVSE